VGAAISTLTKGVADTWGKLGKTQKIVISSAAALVFVAASIALVLGTRGAGYETLFSGLDAVDAGSIVTELERQGIPYKIVDGGKTIEVPSDNLYRTRLSLASQGLPSSGIVGFESISGSSIWATDFERKVQYVRALSGELTRTVKSISGVQDARVHIALPEDTVFSANKTPVTAAVLLQLLPTQELSASTVKGIMNLVARSVEGLSPDQVTVLDNSGRLLSQEYSDASSLEGTTSAAIELTSRVERDIEKRLISMLTPVLGAGNVVCQVRANLNLDQSKTTEDAYVADPENPQGILRSTQQIVETYEGTGTPAGGTAGGLDVPTYASGTSGDSKYQHTETTNNYEVTRKTTETLVNPGTIKNLSVAVMVNKDMDEDQVAVITESVSAALGLDPLRQDRISVTAIAFDTSLADQLLGAGDEVPPLNRAYIYGAAIAAALLIGTLILFLLRRRRKTEPELEPELPLPMLEEEDAVPALSAEIKSKQKLKENVERMARINPESVATLIKSWLLEDEQ